jgi:ABC-type transporter Mla subunit MlaD
MKEAKTLLLKFLLLVLLIVVFLGFASQLLFWLFEKFGYSMAVLASFQVPLLEK